LIPWRQLLGHVGNDHELLLAPEKFRDTVSMALVNIGLTL
jgi:hypothetical protein